MPYPGTASPGEGETETISPVMPTSQGSSPSTSTTTYQQPVRSIQQLQRLAENGDAGAQVDLRVQEMQQQHLPSTSMSTSTSPQPPSSKKLVPPKGWLHFVAGGAGGMCGAIITSPLDVVKTRLQSD
ncbi:hypothetical protein BCV70DRAFT_219238, partial [Testicularia cyperi]